MLTWLITGASSGLGRALAERALASGHRVVAAVRDTDAVADLVAAYPDAAAAVRMDLSEVTSVHRAVREAQHHFDGLDVVVNNAGYAYTAAVEEGEAEAVQRLFATNLFGPAALIQAVLPAMRARGSGTIVTVSTIGTRTTLAGGGWYSAAKAGLEALSGSLRREVEPFGIRVVVVQPGSMRTDFRGRSAARAGAPLEVYDRALGRSGETTLPPQKGDPEKAAAAVVAAVELAKPPQLLVLGSDALEGHRSAQAEQEHDMAAFEHLTLSTDA